jgi:hypothetical protein
MDRQELLKYLPPDPLENRTPGVYSERLQVYHEDGAGSPSIFSVPAGEKFVIQAQAIVRGMSMSEMGREAVAWFARQAGLVHPTQQEINARDLAKSLGRDPDELVRELGIAQPAFRPTIERIARWTDISLARAFRWALRAYWANTDEGRNDDGMEQ